MEKITTLIFDLGGVIAVLDFDNTVRTMTRLGVPDAATFIDPYEQRGFFGQLERGEIGETEFCSEMSRLVGRPVDYQEMADVLIGFMGNIPARNLECMLRLRSMGYRLIVISNTNPFVLRWVRSHEFDGCGHGIDYYFDSVYASCECHTLKPDPAFFRHLLKREQLDPAECFFFDDSPRNVQTAQSLGIPSRVVENGSDWATPLLQELGTRY